MTESHEESRNLSAYSARAFSLVSVVATLITLIMWQTFYRQPNWPWISAFCVVAVCAGAAYSFSKLPKIINIILFSCCALAILAASTIMSVTLASHPLVHFEAFAGSKLISIAVAVICPSPVWLGYLTIVLCGVVPIVHFYSLTADHQALFAIQEPWYSVIYAVVAGMVLYQRRLGIGLVRQLEKVKTEKRALDELAGVLLAVRDLANTPLQAIEITTAFLASGKLSGLEGASHLEKALHRLRSLSRVLATYRKDIDWLQAQQSFKAVIDLERKLKNSSEENHHTMK